MERERLSRGWLIGAVLIALAGLLAFGASVVWVVSMAGAADTRILTLPFLGAALASLAVVAAIPVLQRWRPPRWARVVLPIAVGLFAVVAAGGVWVLMSLLLCGTDGVCRPVDTWAALPSLVTCGVLTASGPGVGALAARDGWRGRLWVLTVILGLLGFVVALVAWVELGVYPVS